MLAAFVLACGSPPPAEPPPVPSSEPVANAAPDAESEGEDTRSEAVVASTPTAAAPVTAPPDPDDPMVALPEASPPARVPGVSAGALIVSGQLHPSRIQVRLRERFGEFRHCHPQGAVSEHVRTGFVIGREGKVTSVNDAGSTSADGPAAQCVRTIIAKLEFQPPKRGRASVKYTLTLGEP